MNPRSRMNPTRSRGPRGPGTREARELALGIVGDFWTPRAAEQALRRDADDAEEECGALRTGRQHGALEEQSRALA